MCADPAIDRCSWPVRARLARPEAAKAEVQGCADGDGPALLSLMWALRRAGWPALVLHVQ